MKQFEIWSEGCILQEGIQPAIFHGKFKGNTFDEAVESYINNSIDAKMHVDKVSLKHYGGNKESYENRPSNWMYWGCFMFDNAKQAKEKYG